MKQQAQEAIRQQEERSRQVRQYEMNASLQDDEKAVDGLAQGAVDHANRVSAANVLSHKTQSCPTQEGKEHLGLM